MAMFNAIITRSGRVAEMEEYLEQHSNSNWKIVIADNEEEAIEAAREKFEDAYRTSDITRDELDSALEDISAYEFDNKAGVHMGWKIYSL